MQSEPNANKRESTALTITVREVCRLLGLTPGKLRRLEGFPPIEWLGPRSGFILRQDFEQWFESRWERDSKRKEERQRLGAFVSGTSLRTERNQDELPEFLR